MAARSAKRLLATLALAVAAGATVARSDGLAPQPGVLSPGPTFSEETGESLYANVCQGCHMPDGKGAEGAGRYPSLANNDDLASRDYAVVVVVHGLRGMPAFGRSMSDRQVAAVVNYVRAHFGNAEADPVTDADVAAARR